MSGILVAARVAAEIAALELQFHFLQPYQQTHSKGRTAATDTHAHGAIDLHTQKTRTVGFVKFSSSVI